MHSRHHYPCVLDIIKDRKDCMGHNPRGLFFCPDFYLCCARQAETGNRPAWQVAQMMPSQLQYVTDMSMMTAKAMMVSGMPVLTKVLASKVSVLKATMF